MKEIPIEPLGVVISVRAYLVAACACMVWMAHVWQSMCSFFLVQICWRRPTMCDHKSKVSPQFCSDISSQEDSAVLSSHHVYSTPSFQSDQARSSSLRGAIQLQSSCCYCPVQGRCSSSSCIPLGREQVSQPLQKTVPRRCSCLF